jgi:hypothetical protein
VFAHFFQIFETEVDVVVTMAFLGGLEWYLEDLVKPSTLDLIEVKILNDIVYVNEVIESMRFNGGNETFLKRIQLASS